jgi:HEPN domain-containing protein
MKARRDLLSAKRLSHGKDPYLDTAIYHCQQSVEKAVKGWLVYNDQSFGKTHDLRLLMTQASEVEPKFKK